MANAHSKNPYMKQIDHCQAWAMHVQDRIVLISYETAVLSISAEMVNKSHDLKRHWAGRSNTTSKQIGKFLEKYAPELSYHDYKRLEACEL